MQLKMPHSNLKLATFGGGCFWCTEAVFSALKGVIEVESGYAGGATENPNYDAVSSGATGHAEVVRISFDDQIITFGQLVGIFFLTHIPTTKNRQGADVGSQYRSIILYHNEDQKRVAESVKNQLERDRVFDRPILTEIAKFDHFYPAENYHQQYSAKNPDSAYCQAIINPKIAKLRQQFSHLIK